MNEVSTSATLLDMPLTRGYQQEMLDDSLRRNIIIALDTGSGKTHIAVLRLRYEMDREPRKISWFFAPTVALCEQQKSVLKAHLPVSVGLISGSNEPNQWKNATLWADVLRTHRVMVSTPQVFLDALRHGYISLGKDISLIVFDEAHHAVDNHPYNRIMMEFYFVLPVRTSSNTSKSVRPMVLGLTASPIYGGDVVKAFQNIENNLDCTIRAPVQHRSELARYVYRPRFRHVMYQPSDPNTSFSSTNLASLTSIISTIDIENDPYVISLRSQLAALGRGSFEYNRVDQKLSKVVNKEDSFTHKGLRDFQRAAEDICQDIGAWAADWFVWKVVERAKDAANPFNNMMVTWKRTEKAYLLSILDQVIAVPASYYPDDIAGDLTDKVEVLIDCLLMEKGEAESLDETYSVIIFVQRRDTVLALAEVLNHHPLTKDVFRIGVLLGTSESRHRHSMMDITRILLRDPQDETIADFKTGDKNLIVSTSVAEEGIDIQACGSVIRWDPPMNMASWVQSRGRARKERSSFTVMFEKGSAHQASVTKWETLEKQMVELYNNPSRQPAPAPEEVNMDEDDIENNDIEFQVESTGALLTLHSAVSHLMHFCAVIPNNSHVINQPYYAVDPPEFPEGWHAFAGGHMQTRLPYTGPYGSRVTLPRSLPLPERHFSVDCVYKNIISAHRHSAFKAYKALYDAGLLNENLLPITSVLEPELEEEVKAMLADVEKRQGLAKISMSINPWLPTDSDSEEIADSWYQSRLHIGNLPPLFLFTRSEFVKLDGVDGPLLYRAGIPPIRTSIEYVGRATLRDSDLYRARDYTRRIFWGLNYTRMEWNDLDFSYLIFPVDNGDQEWDARRSWLSNISNADSIAYPYPLMARANELGAQFGYPSNLTLIQRQIGAGTPFKFVRWQYEAISEEEEEAIRGRYKHITDLEITYPLLVVEKFPPRSNFLIPISPPKENSMNIEENKPPAIHFIPRFSGVVLLSPEETEYAFLLPSVLRFLSMSITANSLRNNVFTESSISVIPLSLLVTAITAPSSGEKLNYQRMETLGDTVLKFMAGIQLLAEYPLWHEGYLTRKKDHAVSNVRLAKEDIERGLYRWIIRDNMLGKKWKPDYFTIQEESNSPVGSNPPQQLELDDRLMVETLPKKKSKKKQELSTKVLADVVESIIGAAYLHGGFSLGYECTKYFDLGLKWEPIPARVDQVLSRVEQLTEQEIKNFPPQLFDVEKMLGYTFRQKLLLVEALTHVSYQSDSRTPSYERMEFLGDSVLDMIVTDYLYHAPGKNYSPGHMHLRKSAVVNGHILAYICLKTQLRVEAVIPHPDANGQIEVMSDAQDIFLWKCLLHSSHKVLEDQQNTFARFRKRRDEIEDSLMKGTIFPWAALTRLQAPKFFSDMMESVIGAAFLDCGGSIPVVRDILVQLGIMPLLEHIVLDNVDVLHPVSRLSMWAQKHDKEIRYDLRREEGKAICTILVDDKEEVTVSDEWRGKPSQDEVKFAAAEMAIKQFKLRNDGVSYDVLKKKKVPKPKKKKQKQKKDS